MRLLFIASVALSCLAPVAAAQADDRVQLAISAFDGLEQYVEIAESRWEDAFEGRMKRRDGTPVGADEVLAPLARARDELARTRERLAQVQGPGADSADWETAAMATVELRWSLALEEARRRVELVRAEADGGTGHADAGRALEAERRTLVEHVGAWIALAEQGERQPAWEAWAELADATLDVGEGDELPSQLDDFLRSSRVVRIDPSSGARTELDLAGWFEPLAIRFPDDDVAGGVYPDLSDLPTSRLIGTFAVCLSQTDSHADRVTLVRALEESHAVFPFPDTREDLRVLMVLGEGLVPVTGEAPELTDEHPWMDYHVLSATAGADEPTREEGVALGGFLRLLAERGIDSSTYEGLEAQNWMLGYDRVSVLAVPRPGAMPGAYRFRLDGHEIEWPYGRSDDAPAAVGELRLARLLPTGDTAPVAALFEGDRFRIELELDREVDATELEVSLAVDTGEEIEPVDLEGRSGVTLALVEDSSTLYRSRELRAPVVSGGLPAPDPEDTLRVPEGARLLVALPRATPIASTAVAATFALEPGRLGHSWHTAWVHACEHAGLDSGGDHQSTKHVDRVSTGGWLDWGAHDVTIMLGDLAALYLVRDEIQRLLEARRGTIVDFCERLASDDELAERWYEVELRANARTRQSRMGTLPLELEGVQGETLWEAFLHEPRDAAARREHARRVARAVAASLLGDLDGAIAHAQGIERTDLEGLIRLAGVGLDPMRDAMLPNLLRREKVGAEVWWVPEREARMHLPTIETLHRQLVDAEALQDAELDVLVAIGGVVTPFAQALALRGALYVGNRLVVGVRGVTSFWEVAGGVSTLYNKGSQFVEQRRELAFARGSLGVLAHERWQTAVEQVKPAWMLLAEAAGGVVGGASELVPLVQAVRIGRYRSPYAWTTKVSPRPPPPPRDTLLSAVVDDIVAEVEAGGLEALRALSSEDRNLLLGVLGLASDDAARAARLLTDRVQRRVTALMEALEDHLEATRAKRFDEQDWFREIQTELGAGVLHIKERPAFLPDDSGQGWKLAVRSLEGEEQVVGLGVKIGEGGAAAVYEVRDLPDRVLKLLKDRDLAKAQREIEVSLRTQARLRQAGIAHLGIVGYGNRGDMAYTVCERLPANARVHGLRRVRNDAGQIVPNGYRGLEPEQRLPRAFQHAIVRLYKRLAEAGLVWEDGHLDNLYFYPKGLYWEAGILDLDRIVPFGDLRDADSAMDRLLTGIGQGYFYVNSMKGAGYLGSGTWDVLVDADFTMQKMLEHRGMIAYRRGADEWSARHVDLDVVERYFPGFRGHTGSLNNEVREARR